jgi:hypothetical protein
MSKLGFTTDFDVPFTEKGLARLMGRIQAVASLQLVATSLATATLWQADFAGYVGDLYIVSASRPAAGESMQYDLLKNSVSILTAPFTLTASNWLQDQINFFSSITTFSFKAGDFFTVTRTYTAGGAPTPLGVNQLGIEPTGKRWQ